MSEKASKSRFLNPRSSKITVTKEKERRKKGKCEEKEGRRREKKAMVVLLVFIIATLVYFEITFSKIPLKVH